MLQTIHPNKLATLEAETAELADTRIVSERRGFTGKGYVTGFEKDTSKIVFRVTASAGLYNVRIRFATPSGTKGYTLAVNGTRFSGMFRATNGAFEMHDAGKVELTAGENTIAVEKNWGYFDIDALIVEPAGRETPLLPVAPKPVNAKATASARGLLQLLTQRYGKATMSGQYERNESEYISATTGQTPAVLGLDLMEFSPSRRERGANPGDLLAQAVRADKAGQIITLSWHWNAPAGLRDEVYKDANGKEIDARWYKGFYTNATTFDVERALADPKGADYKLFLRDIDVIAESLRELANADVPILWRPLHEAEGKWFWWGAKGGKPFIALWKLLYDRLTNHHKLNNLIWVYTGETTDYYPGDAVVDIVGVDMYTDVSDPLAETWERLKTRFNGKKLIALTEFGGVPDVQKMQKYGVRWSFFVSWTGGEGPKKISPAALKRIYAAPPTANLSEIAPLRRKAA